MTNNSRVAILMGSDSDWDRLKPCAATLREHGEEPIVRVLSAHRTPEETADFATNARANGICAIICAAGGAAHLAGVVAAHTTLPVIGVPLDNPPMDGMDSLLATVQMPGGVPVATVGAGRGGPVNAALLALRIIGVADADTAARMDDFKSAQRDRVLAKDAGLQENLEN
ncbi:MAG TPA: 5-(carboxyamino)imidazole ribonucleotide mutase [Planctomycetes bacterium]|nr:5-(carboxyamino)imidazole ribonucleotide mutase [Planctomycetota bacterium]|tara:strand:- start:21 stop:530 length:510 start_codon:yes stop_codon:yes gene_type:complete